MIKQPLTFKDTAYLNSLRKRKTHQNHIHWDGSIPAKYLFKRYQERSVPLLLPETDLQGTKIKNRLIKSVKKLEAFQQGLLTKYDIVSVFGISVGAMQTEQDLKEMAIAHCHYLKSQGTLSAETRFAPSYHTLMGLSMDQVIGYSLEGFAQGQEETGVAVKPIICINREVNPEKAKDIVKAALNFAERGVVGIDLACYEPSFPPELFVEAFTLTFDSPLKRTAHAGEMCDKETNLANIKTGLTKLRVNGIGHAIPLYKSPELIQLMLDNQVRLESNPICNRNFFINEVADLHLDELVEAGILVTINSDDPAMWPNGDLAHNLYVLGKLYGNKFVDKVIENAEKTAWR